MKRFLGRLTAVVAVVAAVGMVGSSSAHAGHPAVGGATVVGSGTISPGLTSVPTNQSVTFSGTGVAVAVSTGSGATYTGPVNCSFSASGSGETSVSGGGSATGTCSGSVPQLSASVTASCSLSYSRVGGEVLISGSCRVTVNSLTGNGVANASVTGAFQFVPTSANPTTSYLLAGSASLVATSH